MPKFPESAEEVLGLRADRDRFVAFAFAGADLLIEVDTAGLVRFAAGASVALIGCEPETLVGQPLVDLFAPAARDHVSAMLDATGISGRADPSLLDLKSGDAKIAVVVNACRLPDRRPIAYVAITRPPVALTAGNRRRTRGSRVPSRDFRKAANAYMTSAKDRGADIELTLLRLCGLDDRPTHVDAAAADAFLASVDACLPDGPAADVIFGQIGEAEFGILSAINALDADFAGRVRGHSAQSDIGGPFHIEEKRIDLGYAGMASADAVRALVYTFQRFVEAAPGTFPFRTLKEALEALIEESTTRISTFRSNVLDRGFDLAFQPIVDLTTLATHHCEVLTRFDGGNSPAELIRYAEGVGIIEDVDFVVCQRVIDYLSLPKTDVDIALAVNLSGRSLESRAFVKSLMALLALHDRLGDRLLFEVTESIHIKDLPAANAVLQELRGRGHPVCLDDFGAGAASFPYLQALDVDFVKIDGAYIGRMMENARDRAILKGMTSICNDLGVGTIAEMVQNRQQLEALRELGVHYGQGYLFAKPFPIPASRRERFIVAESTAAEPILTYGGGQPADLVPAR